jgi:hypothetical protein
MNQPKDTHICDKCLQIDADYVVFTLLDTQLYLCDECFEEQAKEKN